MPLIPVGYGQVTHLFSGAALPRGAAVTMGFAVPDGPSIDTVAGMLHDAFGDHILPKLTQDVQLDSSIVKYGPNEDGPRTEHSDVVVGSGGTQTSPPQVCYLVRKQTLLGGRKNRGRWYLPGVPEAAVLWNGAIGATEQAGLQTAVNGYLGELSTAGVDLVILHNQAGLPTTISQLVADGRSATQRDRLR
jgi:hypothetical protein